LAGTPFLNNLAGTPIFLKKGLGCFKKVADAPLLSENGVPAKFTIPKLPTKFSFGISMVKTGKYQPIPTKNTESISNSSIYIPQVLGTITILTQNYAYLPQA
jgi:hypothetical protein